MCYAVLRCVEWRTAWGDVGRWDDVEVVLVRDEICMKSLATGQRDILRRLAIISRLV